MTAQATRNSELIAVQVSAAAEEELADFPAVLRSRIRVLCAELAYFVAACRRGSVRWDLISPRDDIAALRFGGTALLFSIDAQHGVIRLEQVLNDLASAPVAPVEIPLWRSRQR
jgi:hypothetical protein